jgi:DNA-binding NarL/FixJ family response regulator
MTNRQIAQALFVALQTVEMHLSSAYGKLEIRSRLQLPEAFASHEPQRRAVPPSPGSSDLKGGVT